MSLFFTRRTYNAQTAKFTNNAAALTRYVEITAPGDTVSKGHIIDQATWKARVLTQMQVPELLIYVHGFNTSQTDMLRRERKIEVAMRSNGFRGAVICFDWPSDGNALAYDADRNDAKEVAPYLVTEGIGLFLNETPRIKIHLIAHSMGALLTLRGFSGVGDAPGARKWDVDQALFVSGDVDSEWMRSGAWGALVMDLRANRLTNYYSTDDGVLQLSGSVVHGGRKRAGRKGMPDLIPDSFEDVRTTEQYRVKVPGPERSLLKSHNWYYDDPGFLRDVALTVAGTPAQQMPTRHRANINDLVLLT